MSTVTNTQWLTNLGNDIAAMIAGTLDPTAFVTAMQTPTDGWIGIAVGDPVLATKVSETVTNFIARDNNFDVWINGTPSGGAANPDGTGTGGPYYPLRNLAGGITWWPSPAGMVSSTQKGDPGGIPFLFLTATTDADPGSGKFKFDNATFASITKIFIDNNEAGGTSVAAWLDSFDDSTTTSSKGVITFLEVSTSKFATFRVTGSIVDGTGYRKISVTPLAGNAPFSNNSRVVAVFSPTGDKGDKGWSPQLAAANDGSRRVLRVTGWAGGEGAAPATGLYVGASGLVTLISDALDIRGPQGAKIIEVAYATRASLYADLAYSDGAFGLVWNDSTFAYNATYIKSGAPGTGSWVKQDTAVGLGLQALPAESGYAFAIVDNLGRAALMIAVDSTITFTKVGANSIPASALLDGSITALQVALASLTRDRMATDVSSVLAMNLDPLTGYVFGIMDTLNRAAFLVRNTGEVEIPTLVLPNNFVSSANLTPALRAVLPYLMSSPETGYVFAIADALDRAALTVSTSGVVEIPSLALGPNTVDLQNLKSTVRSLLPYFVNAESGYVFAIVDSQDRLAFGVRTDGSIYGGFTLPDGSIHTIHIADGAVTGPKIANLAVSAAKLDAPLQRQSVMKTTDVVSVYPDDWRGKQGRCANRTEPSGYGWSPFPKELTPLLQGANDSGVSLQFRRRSQLLIRGRRYINTFDPAGSGPDSKVLRGNFQLATSWPPSGTFAAGDYYEYGDTPTRTIGSDTYSRGDVAVWTGSAWARQAKPPGATGVVGDWWSVTSAGWWRGNLLAVNDVVFLHGVKSQGGPAYYEWGKGAPDQGEFFLKGEWSAATSLPSTSTNGDLYQVTAAGTVGGYTFAVDDYLIKDDGVWGRIPSEPVIVVANTSYVHLPCWKDSGEWEFRTTAKSTTRVGLSLKCRVQTAPRRNDDGIVMYGDSMVGLIMAAMATAFGTRSFNAFTYGGGSFTDVLAMITRDIRELGDAYRGRGYVVWAGQNGFADFTQNEEQALRLINLIGARDCRFLFMMILGQRIPTWNGTRLVFDHFEDQKNSVASSPHVKLREFYKRVIPDQWFDTRLALAATAGSTPDLQFPGMTEAQVATTYGIPPLTAWLNYTAAGIVPASMSFQGYRSADGLPTGGSVNDYYLRSGGVPANGESNANGVGNILANIAGTWVEVTFDKTHFYLPSAQTAVGNAVQAVFDTKGW